MGLILTVLGGITISIAASSLSLNMCILTIYNLFLVNNCLTCLNFSTTDYGSRICVDFCEVWFYYFVLDDRSSCVADAIQLD